MRVSCRFCLLIVSFCVTISVCAAQEDAAPAAKAILSAKTLWRVRMVWETDEILLKDGSIQHARLKYDTKPWWGKVNTIEDFEAVPAKRVRMPDDTSARWMASDFDDSTWVRARGPFFAGDPEHRYGGWGSSKLNWKLLLLRGRFAVSDPATAGDLTFSTAFRGGLVVYLNGEEVARSHMPKGKVDPYTNADPYPVEVYMTPNGRLISTFDHRIKGVTDRVKARMRRLTDFRIPAAKLRKGVNVLAVAVHRSPADWRFYTTRVEPYAYGTYDERAKCRWSRMALWSVDLSAAADSPVAPNIARKSGGGFRAWNQSILRRVYTGDFPDPHETLQPVRITGVRNGLFAGQVVVGHDEAIEGLTVQCSALRGPGQIPASAVGFRFGLPDGHRQVWRNTIPPWFDSLEEFAPAVVPVRDGGGSVQPIWISVRVPADAKPGDYRGTITIRAKGLDPIETPLALRVADWTLSHVNDFVPDIDIIQSPESIALAYDVPLWSEKHWALLAKSFEQLSLLAVKTLYVTSIRRTHFGNEHAMIRFTREADGTLTPDFSIAEKYLDLAVKHMGRIPGVILYCWEPPTSMGHAGSGPSRTHDRDIYVSVLDPKTGELTKQQAPKWGTPACAAFWKRLGVGFKKVLARRGIEDSLMFGLLGDHRATKLAMDQIVTGSPGTEWALHSHNYCDNWMGHKIRMCIALWGCKCYPVEPEKGYGYGWDNPFWLGYYPREMDQTTAVVEHRVKIENHLGSLPWSLGRWPKSRGIRGIGRLGADFWVVLKDKRGRLRGRIAARYPETYWGQLCLNYGVPALLGKGRDGALATVRSEGFRENLQEIEARIFLQNVLKDETQRGRIGKKLAARCQEAVDGRIRACLRAAGEGWLWFVSSGWEKRTELLFTLAAEVSEKLGS